MSEMLNDEESHPAISMMAAWALPKMGFHGEVLMYEHRRAQEATKIAAEDTNSAIGRCYRGVGDMMWSLSQKLYQKASELLPESINNRLQPSSGFGRQTTPAMLRQISPVGSRPDK